jgi:hypothetical protein
LIKVVFVALHDELMGPCDQREIIDVIELLSACKRGRKGGPPGRLYRRITSLRRVVRQPTSGYLPRQ